ncbi:hypothetical protein F5887DRAFT_1082009 [Amanita rubescens]|nr:hypothetical protein F5887DRAFT_1082009 [Amanita rubescens]
MTTNGFLFSWFLRIPLSESKLCRPQSSNYGAGIETGANILGSGSRLINSGTGGTTRSESGAGSTETQPTTVDPGGLPERRRSPAYLKRPAVTELLEEASCFGIRGPVQRRYADFWAMGTFNGG